MDDFEIILGRRDDLSNAEYHAAPGLSSSGLKAFWQSPKHYRYYKAHGIKETPAMRLGSAVHCYLLEPERFAEEYETTQAVTGRRSAEDKLKIANAQLSGKIVLTEDEWVAVQEMGAEVRRSAYAREATTGGTAEISIFWEYETQDFAGRPYKILCKCRPDYVKFYEDGSYIVVDVKSCADARPREFHYTIQNFAYHIQAAFYTMGCAAAFGRPPKEFYFLCAENVAPHCMKIGRVHPRTASASMAETVRLLGMFRDCMLSNEWPGYDDTPYDIILPDRAIMGRGNFR